MRDTKDWPICHQCQTELHPEGDYHTTNEFDSDGNPIYSIVYDWCPEHCPECNS